LNIVQALNKVKTDILNFVTENLQLKANVDHTHDVLGSHQYGDELPEAGTVGRIFFKKVNN
jgi:hypothetical protein